MANEIVTSLTIDDSGYQAGADRVVAADKKMVGSQAELQASTERTAAAAIQVAETQRQIIPATTGSAAAFERLRQRQDETYGAQQRIAKATRDAEAAVRAKKATDEQAAAVLASYRAELDGTAAAQRRLAEARAADAAAGAQRQFNTVLGVNDPTTGAAARSAAVFQEQIQAQEEAAKAMEQQAAAAQRYKDQLNPLLPAQRAYRQSLNEINALAQANLLTETQRVAAIQRTKDNFALQVRAIRDAENASRNHAGAVKLQSWQMANLAQQVQDVAVQLGSGTSPFIVALQQGPQITSAMGGVKNAFALALSFVNPFTVGMAAAAGAIAVVGARALDLAGEARQMGVALRAMGKDAELSAAQFNRLVESMRDQGISKADARSALTASIRIPGASGADIARATALAPDFAAGFGVSIQDAQKQLVELGTVGYTAIKKLDDAYNFLSPAQARQIRELAEQGRQAEATAIAYGALEERLKGLAKESMSPGAEAVHDLGRAWDDLIDTLAKTEAVVYPIEQLAKFIGGIGRSIENGSFKQALAAIGELPLINLAIRTGDKVLGTDMAGSVSAASQAKPAPADISDIGKPGARPEGSPGSGGGAGAFGVGRADAAENAARIAIMQKYVQNEAETVERENQVLRANADVRELVRARLAAEDEALKNNLKGKQYEELIALRVNQAREKLAVTIRDQTRALNEQIAAQNEAAKIYVSGGLAGGLEAEARARARQERLSNPTVDVDKRTQEILREQAAGEALSLSKALEAARRANQDLASIAAAGGAPAAVEAARRQAEANQRFATAEALGVPGVEQLKQAWIDTAKATADYNRQVQANADRFAQEQNLQLLQREYELLGQNEAVRERELALLREKQRLVAQGFEGAALDEELAKRRATVEETARLTYEINAAKEADRDFRQAAREGLLEIVSGFQDAITHARSWKDVVNSLGDSLLKLGNQVFIEQPLARWLDRQLSGRGDMGDVVGDVRKFLGLGGPGPVKDSDLSDTAKEKIADAMQEPARDLTGAARTLVSSSEKVPSIFERLLGNQITSSINIQAATVTVNGGIGFGGGGGGGGFLDLFGTAGIPEGLPGGATNLAATDLPAGYEMFAAYLHSGGKPGGDGAMRTINVDPAAVRAAPRAHTGLGPDERLVVALRNERILSPTETRAFEAGRSSAGKTDTRETSMRRSGNTTINFHFPPGTDARGFMQSRPQIEAMVARSVSRGRRGL